MPRASISPTGDDVLNDREGSCSIWAMHGARGSGAAYLIVLLLRRRPTLLTRDESHNAFLLDHNSAKHCQRNCGVDINLRNALLLCAFPHDRSLDLRVPDANCFRAFSQLGM